MVVAGGLTDKLGTRKAFAIAICLWSVAAMLPGAAFSVITFAIAMFLLGLGEAANFPACIKTVAEWFPKRERALATGIFNSGANIGNIVVPAGGAVSGGLVQLARRLCRRPELWASCGWSSGSSTIAGRSRTPQRFSGRTGPYPQRSGGRGRERSLEPRPAVQGNLGLRHRQVSHRPHLVVLSVLASPLSAVHVPLEPCRQPAAGGDGVRHLHGGQHWRRMDLLLRADKRGKSPNVARKTAMLVCALAVVPVFAAPFVHHLWLVVALVGLATAAHQGWSANLFTLPSDMFPKSAVASVVGIGGMMGAIGSVLLQPATGLIVSMTHSYVPLFVVACVAYPVALIVIHSISPRLAPARMDKQIV